MRLRDMIGRAYTFYVTRGDRHSSIGTLVAVDRAVRGRGVRVRVHYDDGDRRWLDGDAVSRMLDNGLMVENLKPPFVLEREDACARRHRERLALLTGKGR